MKFRLLAVAAIACFAAACAKNPESITPMTMPVNAYSGLTCPQLASELQKSQGELTIAESSQRSAVQGDALGVFLIGVPVSSLSGADKEGIIAQKKGEVIAIQAAQRNGGCAR